MVPPLIGCREAARSFARSHARWRWAARVTSGRRLWLLACFAQQGFLLARNGVLQNGSGVNFGRPRRRGQLSIGGWPSLSVFACLLFSVAAFAYQLGGIIGQLPGMSSEAHSFSSGVGARSLQMGSGSASLVRQVNTRPLEKWTSTEKYCCPSDVSPLLNNW